MSDHGSDCGNPTHCTIPDLSLGPFSCSLFEPREATDTSQPTLSVVTRHQKCSVGKQQCSTTQQRLAGYHHYHWKNLVIWNMDDEACQRPFTFTSHLLKTTHAVWLVWQLPSSNGPPSSIGLCFTFWMVCKQFADLHRILWRKRVSTFRN